MRKIILTAIFILTLIVQSFVSAADFESADWNRAPRIGNKNDFVAYIKNCEQNCQTLIPMYLANDLVVKGEEFLKFTSAIQAVNTTFEYKNGKPNRVLYEVQFYPGARVEYAYRTGNTSILTGDERQLYARAVQIVGEAKRQPTILRRELYIHDAITQASTYYTESNQKLGARYLTAIGALIDGRANCQGYADAFYMLGRMCGFNVGKINGVAKEPHTWNTIEFGDGRYYCVDVTWDDPSFKMNEGGEYNNYIYFNVPLEIIKSTHNWERNYYPQIVQKADGRYFYMTKEFSETRGKYFGFHSRTAEDALNYIARRIADEGCRLSWAMVPYSSKYADTSFVGQRLVNEILPRNYHFAAKARMSVTHCGNYLFITVDAVRNN